MTTTAHSFGHLCLTVLAIALLSGCQAYDDSIVVSAETKTAAIDYLAALPADTPVFMWPTRMHRYEAIGDDSLRGSLDRYLRIRGNAFPFGSGADISVIAATDNALRQSSLPPGMLDAVARAQRSADGCSAYLSSSRDTWAGLGAMVVDMKRFGDMVKVDECLHSGLDYLNGVPTAQGHFDLQAMPSAEARAAILAASRQCSTEGLNASHPDERTRDGMTPLPTIACLIQKLERSQVVPKVAL